MPCKPTMRDAIRVIEGHGFMTFPHFLDNNYIEKGIADVKYLDKWLRRYGNGLIRFVVAPDYMIEEALKLKEEWPDIEWIWPLHKKEEPYKYFEWIGFPHDTPRRDYDLKTFFEITKNKKKWYLGYHEGMDPGYLLYFDAFDTTIPTFYASKHKLWHDWMTSEFIGDLKINYHEIVQYNVLRFKISLRRLFRQSGTQQRLLDYSTFLPKIAEIATVSDNTTKEDTQ